MSMERLLAYLPENLDFMVLAFLRVSGLIFSSPIFGRKQVPAQVRVGLCLTASVVMLAGMPSGTLPVFNGAVGFALLCASELLFGVVMGYVTTLFFSVTFTAGQIIDTQMGFGMVNVFDPQSNAQVPVTGNFLNMALLIIFFAVNGHLQLFRIIHLSFERIPVGHVTLTRQLMLGAVEAFCASFVLAINVAMPFIASGLLTEVALGVVIRTVPQMNMFVVGIPLKVIIGLVMLMLVVPVYARFSGTIFTQMYEAMDIMFTGMMAGA